MQAGETVILVGAGLANSLLALRLKAQRPDLRVTLIEQAAKIGGDHTWCWHGSDLSSDEQWLGTLATRSWSGYDVRFPSYERTLRGPYHALRSPDLHAAVTTALGTDVLLEEAVRSVEPGLVTLRSGRRLPADCVIDGRGLAPAAARPCAYQKFHGLFVRSREPHGFLRPLLMDAAVEQVDGYRFIYVLPWSDHELLVEDTRYSDSPELSPHGLERELHAYLAQRGIADYTCTGTESGVLPIPFHGATAPQTAPGLVTAGVRAGLYHPTTGYSLGEAARFASWFVAASQTLPAAALSAAAAARARLVWQRGGFCRRLNNMLFQAASPPQRRRIMAQFYRRDAALIARFYSGSLTLLDRLRIVSGRPPVPVTAGLKAFCLRTVLT